MSFVYLIKSSGFYKIGVAGDVESRMAQLSTGNPFDLELVFCYEFENANVVEASLHQRFSKQRIRGEWFDIGVSGETDFHKICEMLGGQKAYISSKTTEEDVQAVEEVQSDINKFDYAAMFAEGWRMEPAGGGNRGRFWGWRKGGGSNRLYIYGGTVDRLPYPSLEEMRKMFDRSGVE